VPITIYVDQNVRFGREMVEGLRISPNKPERKVITPGTKLWANAKVAYLRDGHLKAVLQRMDISEEHQSQLISECKNVG
jgi:hypothetical protein